MEEEDIVTAGEKAVVTGSGGRNVEMMCERAVKRVISLLIFYSNGEWNNEKMAYL